MPVNIMDHFVAAKKAEEQAAGAGIWSMFRTQNKKLILSHLNVFLVCICYVLLNVMFRTEYLTFYNKLEHEVKYLQSFQNEENYWTVLSETFKLVYWIWKLTF